MMTLAQLEGAIKATSSYGLIGFGTVMFLVILLALMYVWRIAGAPAMKTIAEISANHALTAQGLAAAGASCEKAVANALTMTESLKDMVKTSIAKEMRHQCES